MSDVSGSGAVPDPTEPTEGQVPPAEGQVPAAETPPPAEPPAQQSETPPPPDPTPDPVVADAAQQAQVAADQTEEAAQTAQQAADTTAAAADPGTSTDDSEHLTPQTDEPVAEIQTFTAPAGDDSSSSAPESDSADQPAPPPVDPTAATPDTTTPLAPTGVAGAPTADGTFTPTSEGDTQMPPPAAENVPPVDEISAPPEDNDQQSSDPAPKEAHAGDDALTRGVAAWMGDAPTSAGPDDLGSRIGQSELQAADIRRSAIEEYAKNQERGQHDAAVAKALDGEPTSDQMHPIARQVRRDKDTKEAEQANEERAKGFIGRLKEFGMHVIPRVLAGPYPEGVLPGDPEADVREPVVASPMARTIEPGTLVSRLDEAHPRIGIVTKRIPPLEHNLFEVYFDGDDEPVFMNGNGLAWEGHMDQLLNERAYAEPEPEEPGSHPHHRMDIHLSRTIPLMLGKIGVPQDDPEALRGQDDEEDSDTESSDDTEGAVKETTGATS